MSRARKDRRFRQRVNYWTRCHKIGGHFNVLRFEPVKLRFTSGRVIYVKRLR